jgi:hypothetical protein
MPVSSGRPMTWQPQRWDIAPSRKRRELPPVSAPRGLEVSEYDVYATIECGELRAEIARYAVWDPRDGDDAVRVAFDAKINGLREDGGGVAEIYATDSSELFELAQIAVQTALLLGEARRS